MTREHITFPCGTDMLCGTLDHAGGKTGLLIVTGGNETRAGAFAGQAEIASRLAEKGFPVFRFDRRGVGDSEGANRGFRHSAADIASAIAAFRTTAAVTRIVGFGNCDAASALMLTAGGGCDALVLANPWTFDEEQESIPSPHALRQRYAQKLKSPREVWRLLQGKVSLSGLGKGLMQAMRPAPPPSSLAQEMADSLARFHGPVQFLIAARDRTGLAFEAGWDKHDPRIARCEGATHAFCEAHARDWLARQLEQALSA